MSAVSKFSPQDYLLMDRLAESKSEYINGEIFAMSGASPAHNLVVGNLIRELGNQLKKRPCRVYPSDLRVQVTDGYVYPDVSVVCGQPEFSDKDNLRNPSLIVEVLSPTTADYDLGGKFARYRQLPSLRDYLLVAQDKVHLMHYARRDENHWLLTELSDLQAVLELPGIQCSLAVREVYEKVFE